MKLSRLFLTLVTAVAGYAVWRNIQASKSNDLEVVEPFDVTRYIGKWYELGRVENRFERGLTRTTAEYALNDNGTVRVVNRGFNEATGAWKEAVGVARFLRGSNVGALKVSFFWPFYGGYNIVQLDPDYQWAIIVGSSPKYFWVLSRTVDLPVSLKARAEAAASAAGVSPSDIYWVPHS